MRNVLVFIKYLCYSLGILLCAGSIISTILLSYYTEMNILTALLNIGPNSLFIIGTMIVGLIFLDIGLCLAPKDK